MIERALKAHVERVRVTLGTPNAVTVTTVTSDDWWLADVGSRYYQAAGRALQVSRL